MTLSEQLRTTRRALFDQIEKLDSLQALYEFQRAIAEEIQRSEQLAKKDKWGEHKWHIHLLRSYGDALAWMLLHPYTIRQLAKNPSPPPSLLSQQDSFQYVLETGHEYADKGILVLISDITNCLKIGDLVLCYHPERPGLIECKLGHTLPELLMRGRTGRQISRMMGTLQHLYEGKAKLYGESKLRVAVETTSQIEYTWDIVNRTVSDALSTGLGVGASSDSDLTWAFVGDDSHLEIPQEVRTFASNFEIPCCGCHARPLEEANPRVPPPAVWPIARDCRFALMELEVILFHLVDIQRFAEAVTERGRIIEILVTKAGFNDGSFLVEAGDHRYTLSSSFLADVVYGFQTIESTAKSMIEFASQISELERISKPPTPSSTGRPKLKVVRTIEEAMQLAKEARAAAKGGVVAMPETLFDQINQSRKANSDKDQNG